MQLPRYFPDHEAGESDIKKEISQHLFKSIAMFVMMGLFLGAILREVSKHTKIPYTPMLLFIGMMIGYFRNHLWVLGSFCGIVDEINPHIILLIFIPVLIFQSAYNCQWHIFRKALINILILAGPGVILGAVLMGMSFKLILGYSEDDMTWFEAMTLGCVLSATDPVAVVALLKSLGAGVRFNTLVQGESLMNDGTAMVLFEVFLGLAKGQQKSTFWVIQQFVQTTLGGPLLGFFLGLLMSFWLERIINDAVLSMTITFFGAYLCFYCAQFTILKVSGILSLVVLGLFMSSVGRRKISPESVQGIHIIWAFVQYIAETLIFILTGVIAGVQVLKQSTITSMDWMKMLLFWFLLIFLRAIMILTFYPLLSRIGYGLTRKQMVILIYGGLRGSLGLCLSLILNADTDLTKRFRELAVFYVCGMAVLTIMINGLTCSKIVNWIQMITHPEIKQKLLSKCIKEVLLNTQSKIKSLKNDSTVAYADWQEVQRLVKMGNMEQQSLRTSYEINTSIKQLSREELLSQIRFRFTRYLQKIYWQYYSYGQITEDSIHFLAENCNVINDNPNIPLAYFRVLSASFPTSIASFIIRFRNIPLVGNYSRRFCVLKLYTTYELTTTFIWAAEETMHAFDSSFLIKSECMHEVMSEVRGNIQEATQYIAYLQNTFPSTIRTIHTVKASITILKYKRYCLKQMYEQGFVDDIDYSTLKIGIDKNLRSVQVADFHFSEIELNEIISQCPIFANLSEKTVELIIQKSQQIKYQKGTVIYQIDEQFDSVLLIASGLVYENFEKGEFYFMKGISSFVNPYDFTYRQQSAVEARAGADSKLIRIPGLIIRNIISQNPQFRSQWYKDIFPYSFRRTPLTSKLQSQFTSRKLKKFVEQSTVQVIPAQKDFVIEKGAYIFEGEVIVSFDNSKYSSRKSIQRQLQRGNYIEQRKNIFTITQTIILCFKNYLQIEPHCLPHVHEEVELSQ